jgi:hypothetical protein
LETKLVTTGADAVMKFSKEISRKVENNARKPNFEADK